MTYRHHPGPTLSGGVGGSWRSRSHDGDKTETEGCRCSGGAGRSLGNIAGGFRERSHVKITCLRNGWGAQTTTSMPPECPLSTRPDATARSRSSFAIVHLLRHHDRSCSSRRRPEASSRPRDSRTRETSDDGAPRVPDSAPDNRIPRGVLARPSPPPQMYTGATRQRQCPCKLSNPTIASQPTEKIGMVEKMVMTIRARNSTEEAATSKMCAANLSLQPEPGRSRLSQGFTATLEASSAFLGSAKVMVRLECCE